ncbi:MAG: putative lipid II flippase FtsW [Parcubacteria group bacterium]|nr:putative lipid II flippase FtsW [Parcubacteria group bacterium]
MRKPVDKWFLGIVFTLLLGGFFIFFSASLSLLTRDSAIFSSVVMNQVLGALIGLFLMFVFSRIHYRFVKRYALPFFILSLVATALVFVPEVGFSHGGASRWLSLGPFSFQPSEILKIGFVLYFATWLAAMRERAYSFVFSILPFLVLISLVGVLLLLQPDTGTFGLIFGSGIALLVASGARVRDIVLLGGGALGGLLVLAYLKPYVKERLITFINPAHDPLGIGYQIQQSLIAIGSGGIFGRGFGESIQKFGFLPEPIADSIFAVFAEEFGFIGGLLLITFFVLFVFRGLFIAKHAPDHFSRLTVIGIVILIGWQAFANIGAMLGILPLTGLPLPFVSHGGSALIAVLAGVGIVLNISRHARV